MLGEDILDPYGGAFKVSEGLSAQWPDRVIPHADQRGVNVRRRGRDGDAGCPPILEIMFSDFVALGFDQIVNGIGKFSEMYTST